ncbi:MAG: DUF3426 domain-containing protein [Porticoccaceae bacterium]|nr:DUF3426 domain-containing protein [Porticoccaceae bacterium]
MEEQGTRCPHCQLVFRVAAAHLNAAGGTVRCGMCLTTFDALVNQVGVEQEEPSASPIWADIADDDHIIDDRFDLALLDDGDGAVAGKGIPPELDDIGVTDLVIEDLDLSVLEAGEDVLSGGADLASPPLTIEFDADIEPELDLDVLPPEPEPEFEIAEQSGTNHDVDYPDLGYPGLGHPGADHPGLDDPDLSYQDGDATKKAIEELEKTVFGEDVLGADLQRQHRGSLDGKLNGKLDENQGENFNESLNQNLSLDLSLTGNVNIEKVDAALVSSESLTADASKPSDFLDMPPHLAPPNFTLSGSSLTEIASTDALGELAANRSVKGLDSRLSPGLGAVMILLLGVGILAGQWLFFQTDRFGSQGEYAQLLDPLCTVLPCRGYEFSDLTAIQTKNLVVRTHPRYESALQVDATLVNLAERPQRFPQLILTFEDLQGAVLARRSFKPAEYLKGELDGVSTMPSRQPIHFILDIIDPGELAVSYTLIPAH